MFAPRVNTNIGTRTFSVAAPTLWNMLPSSIRSVENNYCQNLPSFKNVLW